MGKAPTPLKQYVTVAIEDAGGQETQVAVSAANPLPVVVSGTIPVSGGLTDAELRAADVKVTLDGETVPVTAASLPLPAGAATSAKQDTLLAELQLKADLTETQPVSIAAPVAVTGPLTDAQLRATPVPVSGTVTASGPLTDAQLRAAPVEITGAISATSAATATKDEPAYTEGVPEALSQDLAGRLRVFPSALVGDTQPQLVDGSFSPLSLTNDGRLRVASVAARIEGSWFNVEEESMWGDVIPLQVDYKFAGSAWEAW